MNAKTWADGIAEKIYRKEKSVVLRSGDIIPYTAREGRWDDFSKRDVCWWTNGFFAGLMWQLYAAFGDENMRKSAEFTESVLDRNFQISSGMDHDSGFKWLPTAGANYLLTSSPASHNRLMLAADNLAGRFNPSGRFIRAWNDDGDGSRAGIAIIDCMMNLPLLYKAAEISGDPRYAQIALAHSDTVIKDFVRDDGSVCHIVEYDPASGKRLRALGGQGYDENSAWTRGQAWALYGLTLGYRHSQRESCLAAAEKTANYFISHIPESGLVPVDFSAPDIDAEDSSAAAVAACGLTELHKETGKSIYADAALGLLAALAEKRCDFSPETDPLVTRCSVDYHGKEHNIPLVYADYFFTEAILKLCGKETFIW